MEKLYPLHADFLRGNYRAILSLQTKYIYKKKDAKCYVNRCNSS